MKKTLSKRISIEQYNKEIDEAIAQVENGEYYTHEEVERIMIEEYNKELEEAEKEYKKGKYITHEELLREIKKW